jgi:hypothetical protein
MKELGNMSTLYTFPDDGTQLSCVMKFAAIIQLLTVTVGPSVEAMVPDLIGMFKALNRDQVFLDELAQYEAELLNKAATGAPNVPVVNSSVVNSPAYSFPVDAIGNLVMHPNESNDAEVRVVFQPSGIIVVFVIDLIMCLTGKDRNQSGEVWRKLPDDIKALIQSDLGASEGNYNIFLLYLLSS